MSKLVIELQKAALDSNRSMSDVLRIAKVVAHKLGKRDFEQWIDEESNGYASMDEVPDYRQLQGQVKGLDQFGRWLPFQAPDSETHVIMSTRKTPLSVAELENVLRTARGGIFGLPFSPEIENMVEKMSVPGSAPLKLILEVGTPQISGLLDRVRNIVLQWALKLEEEGILGEEMDFSVNEKKAAAQNVFNIKNFIGEVHNSQVQQGVLRGHQSQISKIDWAEVRALLDDLRGTSRKLVLTTALAQRLQADLDTLKAQVDSPQPQAGIFREGIKSMRSIMESAAGNAAGAAFLANIDKITALIRMGLGGH